MHRFGKAFDEFQDFVDEPGFGIALPVQPSGDSADKGTPSHNGISGLRDHSRLIGRCDAETDGDGKIGMAAQFRDRRAHRIGADLLAAGNAGH